MPKILKQMISKIPLFGTFARRVYRIFKCRKHLTFERSDQYWEDRYRLGGNSGSGSYGRLAEFKADFINEFVLEHNINSIVEFGCGDGAQLELARYKNYIGFDVAQRSVDLCREKFSDSSSFSFHLVGGNEFEKLECRDLALSLDVIYHLIEDDVYER